MSTCNRLILETHGSILTDFTQKNLPGHLGLVYTTVEKAPVGQECLAKTWLYEANGGCAGEELKAIKYFIELGFSGLLRPDLLRRSPTTAT